MNEGYHSLIFADDITPYLISNPSVIDSYRHTWDSWHLIPSSRPVFSPPPVKELYQEVPGSNSSLDYTESLTGYPLYGNREGSIEFWVINNQDMPNINQKEWSVLYSEIMNYLHGRKKVVILEDDLTYYYEGRWKVNDWKSDKERSIITLDYNVRPYKMEVQPSTTDWLWDPFNFETGIIREYGQITLEANVEYTLTIPGSTMPSTPHIFYIPDEPSATVRVDYTNAYGVHKTFDGSSLDGTLAPALSPNDNRFPDMILTDTNNTLKFKVDSGSPTLRIYFTGGIL